jgi:hypothetical protein
VVHAPNRHAQVRSHKPPPSFTSERDFHLRMGFMLAVRQDSESCIQSDVLDRSCSVGFPGRSIQFLTCRDSRKLAARKHNGLFSTRRANPVTSVPTKRSLPSSDIPAVPEQRNQETLEARRRTGKSVTTRGKKSFLFVWNRTLRSDFPHSFDYVRGKKHRRRPFHRERLGHTRVQKCGRPV